MVTQHVGLLEHVVLIKYVVLIEEIRYMSIDMHNRVCTRSFATSRLLDSKLIYGNPVCKYICIIESVGVVLQRQAT